MYSGQNPCLQSSALVQFSSVFPLTVWRPVPRGHCVLQRVSDIFSPCSGLLHAAEDGFSLEFHHLMSWQVALQVPHYVSYQVA